MSVICNIPSYYRLLEGLIRSQHKQNEYKFIEVDISKTRTYEDIYVLIKSKTSSVYTLYTSHFSYKDKKEYAPNSHILEPSIVSAAAADMAGNKY